MNTNEHLNAYQKQFLPELTERIKHENFTELKNALRAASLSVIYASVYPDKISYDEAVRVTKQLAASLSGARINSYLSDNAGVEIPSEEIMSRLILIDKSVHDDVLGYLTSQYEEKFPDGEYDETVHLNTRKFMIEYLCYSRLKLFWFWYAEQGVTEDTFAAFGSYRLPANVTDCLKECLSMLLSGESAGTVRDRMTTQIPPLLLPEIQKVLNNMGKDTVFGSPEFFRNLGTVEDIFLQTLLRIASVKSELTAKRDITRETELGMRKLGEHYIGIADALYHDLMGQITG